MEDISSEKNASKGQKRTKRLEGTNEWREVFVFCCDDNKAAANPFMPLQLCVTAHYLRCQFNLWPGCVPNAVACGYKSSPACALTTWGYSWPQQYPEGGEGEQMGGQMPLLFRYFYDPCHPPQNLILVLIQSCDRPLIPITRNSTFDTPLLLYCGLCTATATLIIHCGLRLQ